MKLDIPEGVKEYLIMVGFFFFYIVLITNGILHISIFLVIIYISIFKKCLNLLYILKLDYPFF